MKKYTQFISGVFILLSCACQPYHLIKQSTNSQCSHIGHCHPHESLPCFLFFLRFSDIVVAKATTGIETNKIWEKKQQPFIEKFIVLNVIKGRQYRYQDSLSMNYREDQFIGNLRLAKLSTQKDSIYYIYVNKNPKVQGLLKYILERHLTFAIPKRTLENNHLYTIYLIQTISGSPDGKININYPNTKDLFLKGNVRNGKLRGKFYIYANESDEKCMGLKPKTVAFLEGSLDKNGKGVLKNYDIRWDKKGNNIIKETYSMPFLYE